MRNSRVWMFSTVFGRSRNVTPPTTILVGDSGIDVKDWFSTTGVRQRLPWGSGTWGIAWDAARTTTNNPFTSVDPNLQSGLLLAFSQPLLRDRSIDAAKTQYVIARRNHEISELKFHESAARTVASVKRAYRVLYRSKLKLSDATAEISKLAASDDVLRPFVEFLPRLTRSLIR